MNCALVVVFSYRFLAHFRILPAEELSLALG